MKVLSHRTSPAALGHRAFRLGPVLAVIIYIGLAIWLYMPWIEDFKPLQFVIIFNSVVGATGCFVLSRRWIAALPGSIIAGAVYGFGPFAFGFAAYHPLAGLPLAFVPWLFCPAAFWAGRYVQLLNKTVLSKAVPAALSLLPFAAIILLFWLCAQQLIGPFFPLPKNQELQLANLLGLVVPLALKPQNFIFSVYHIPLAAGLMGAFMYILAGRISLIVIVLAGFCLAFFDSIFQVSPIVWALIPILCCSILAGLGTQALAWSGRSDRTCILVCVLVMGGLAVLTFLLSMKFGEVYTQTAQFHAVATVLLAVMFFIAKASLRWHLLRWSLLCTGIAVDILLCTRSIVDKIF